MASDILGVAVSGLRVSQTSISTVGHNIANAGTEGYSRQRVEPVTNPATPLSGSYLGNGVQVEAVNRVVNQFVIDQMRSDTTLFSDLDTFHGYVNQLDNLLSDDSTGLSTSLNNFFSAVQNGADDPTSIPARQLVINEAENLSDRFNTIYSRMEVIDESVDDALEVAIAQINALASNIAQLNFKVTDALGTADGASPNDLLDQRDEALKELAALVKVQVFDQGNGQLNVVIGTGQALIIGKDARNLTLGNSDQNANDSAIYFNSGQYSEDITDYIVGGEVGGLLRFRDEISDGVYNQLGRVAVVLADSFNKVHERGVDLQDEFGREFFYNVNDTITSESRVIGNANNEKPDDRELALFIRDTEQMTVSDYELQISAGSQFKVTRLEDGLEVAQGSMPGQFPFSVEFDGLELEFESGSFQGGDKFLIQPTRNGAKDFSSHIVNAEALAFASPLLTDASLGNTGSGVINEGEVLALTDADGSALPLFANAGEMAPPMVVSFNTPYSYDILDNSDPSNPVDLDPPIRNQRYIPGVTKNLFPTDPASTSLSTNGDMIGLPEGRAPVVQASLRTAGLAPDFTVTDFSSAANQFSFDLVVSDTLNGQSDGTYTVTINSASIPDEAGLLATINAQLSASDLSAYIADDGSVAFRLNTAGYGNITVQNYDGDPDGTTTAVAGLANNLMGFDVEGSIYSTVGDADGVEGQGISGNGYPAEAITITRPPLSVGGSPVESTVYTAQNATARQIASELGNVPGVDANAFNYLELSNFQFTGTEPLQIQLNGQDLLEYTVDSVSGLPVLDGSIPDPTTEQDRFYDYLADRINTLPDFQNAQIYATAAQDAVFGNKELRIYSAQGDDLSVSFTATAGESLQVGDGEHSPVTMSAAGNSIASSLTVGGRVDVSLDEGLELSTYSDVSMLFGDTTDPGFAKSNYWGIQAAINGAPETGDKFNLDFNQDAAFDNRNAINLVDLQLAKSTAGTATLSQAYGTLVENIGIEANSSRINRDAAERVLEQTDALRNSISGVNLDEEAADLIRFEQMFSANAQVINVAREVFDRLLSAF